jgi:hypothetical protein
MHAVTMKEKNLLVYFAAPVGRFLPTFRDVGPIPNGRNMTLQCTTMKVWRHRSACRTLQPSMHATSTTEVAHLKIGPVLNVQAVNSSWSDCPLNVGPIGCPETSVTSCLTTPHNVPQE